MADLRLQLSRYRYPGAAQDALGELELRFQPGTFTALVGPSGTGKSTLLHLLAGLQKCEHGTVEGLDADLAQALMFQNPRLMPWLSVRQNLELVGDGSASHRQRTTSLLQRVGLADRADAFPGELSGGMQRRAALARAFCVAPALLLMDEPFVSLDEPTAQQLRHLLLELCEFNRPTVVFVTHNLQEALQLADRVLFLSSAPARCVLENEITLPQPRALQQLQELQARLLNQHPHLLSGELSS